MAKPPRKTLGSADAPCVLALMKQMETQSKQTIATWCIDFAQARFIPLYEKRSPGDARPQHALDAARAWLKGEVKLPYVKNIILNEAHAAAREAEGQPALQATARTIAQAASSIHTPTHSLALAFYGAAAIAYDCLGTQASKEEYDQVFEEICAELRASLAEASVENEPNPAKIKWYC